MSDYEAKRLDVMKAAAEVLGRRTPVSVIAELDKAEGSDLLAAADLWVRGLLTQDEVMETVDRIGMARMERKS